MSKIWSDLDKLGVFITVAEKGKINEAAKVLNLTQPSISRSIQKLEDVFGAKLFLRSRDGVKLTKAGALLYEQSSLMLRQLEDVKIRASHTDQEMAGRIVVGTYETLAEYLWPDFIFELRKLHPHLSLSIKTSTRHDPLADLIAGRTDLLVDAEPQTTGEVASWPLYSDRFAFYAATSFKPNEFDQAKARTSTVIFVQQTFDENHLAIEDHLERAGYLFESECAFDSFSTAKRLAILGMGIAVLPIKLAQEDLQAKKIKRIQVKGFPAEGFGRHTIYATVATANEKEFRIKKLIALLKGHFKV